MKKLTILFLTLGFFLTASTVKAEESLRMNELKVEIMPEYNYHPDDKDKKDLPVLIGYHGTLENVTGKSLKGQVSIPLPMNAKNFRVGFVGEYSADRKDIAKVEYTIDENTRTISWEAKNELEAGKLYSFVIEFYVTGMNVKDATRNFNYTFESFAPITNLTINVVAPLNTETIGLSPDSQSQSKNSYGMDVFNYQFSNVKTLDKKAINIEYKRKETRTSLEILSEMEGKAHQQLQTRDNTFPEQTSYIMTALGSIVACGGVLIFLMRRKVKPNVNEKQLRLQYMLRQGMVNKKEYNELLKRIGR